MRRFLDWTAAQSESVSNTATTSSSEHGDSHNSRTHPKTGSSTGPGGVTDRENEVQHLTKLLHEIKYYQASSSPLPSAAGSQSKREFIDKVQQTLPIFLNVFNHATNISAGSSPTSRGAQHFGDKFSNDQIDYAIIEPQSGSQSNPSSPRFAFPQSMDRFPDLLPFTFTIARMFVSEIRQRASNKHAEEASLAILEYLSITSQQQTKNVTTNTSTKNESNTTTTTNVSGWDLLLSLNTLTLSRSPQIIQLLCDASLPSTLIKCLYLFFDLPLSASTQSICLGPNESQGEPATNSHHPLVEAFTQLLVHLCSYQSSVNELIKKDDLRLLIGIASSQCSPHNRSWRNAAFQTLTAISKNMHENFLYLEQNLCVQVYVDNIHRLHSLGSASIEEMIDMIRLMLGFLYNIDSNNRNKIQHIAPLVEQLKASRIIDLIEDLLFKIDETIMQEGLSVNLSDQERVNSSMSQQFSVSSEVVSGIEDHRRSARRLIESLRSLAKINLDQEVMATLTSLKPLTSGRFDMPERFKMPSPSVKGCILNTEAIRLMKLFWSKCHDSSLSDAVLDVTISLFNEDKYNYFVYESQQLLVYYMTSSSFSQFPFRLKQKLFKFLEFIIIETDYIPCIELVTIGSILKSSSTQDVDRVIALKTLIACLRFNSKFSDIFREIGLLEVVMNLLVATMNDEKLSQNVRKLEVLYLLLESSQHLLSGPNNLNCSQFNESGAARHVFNCLSKPKFFHLFIPAHSSSSDDSAAPVSRTSTPTPTGLNRSRQHPLNQQSSSEPVSMTRVPNKPSIKQMQKVAFAIIRQLILSSAGDEHLANLLGLLARNIDDLKTIEQQEIKTSAEAQDKKASHQSTGCFDITFLLSQEVNLKIYILKSLMIILKDDHRCRTLFRKVGGFSYVVSSIVVLEKALSCLSTINDPSDAEIHNLWKIINSRRIWRMIKSALLTIVVAMRSEPVNIRIFSEDVLDRFITALRRLGCFHASTVALQPPTKITTPKIEHYDSYRSIFLAAPAQDLSTFANDNIRSNEACCQIFRFLYDMSLNMADGTTELEECLEASAALFRPQAQSNHSSKSISFDQATDEQSCLHGGASLFKRRSKTQKSSMRPPSLDLNNCRIEPAILTFPAFILAILDLIPSCPNDDLMVFMSLVIKSLAKHERNQQILCENGLLTRLLSPNWQESVSNRNHFLNDFSEYMLEKLTRQSISPRELKMFLRLDDPLCCKNLDEIENTLDVDDKVFQILSEEKIPTSRLETMVAMMGDDTSVIQPPFVEFDMNSDGCASMFMPSIAPVNARSLPTNANSFLYSTLDVHTNEKNGILGGVGSLERQFPPHNGLTYCAWICVEQFPARLPEAHHNIRLLTIYRGSATTGKEYSCFRVQISALDRALTISTQETLLFDNEKKSDSKYDPDCNVRLWTPDLLIEGKWHHVAITLGRANNKQSQVNVYVDGSLVHSQRICYIASQVGTASGPLGNTGSQSGASSAAAFVNAFIGSLPQFRFQQRTKWKLGPFHLIEEPLNAQFINLIYSLGPNFIGNFQSSATLSEMMKMKQTSRFEQDYYQEDYNSTGQHKALVQQQSASAIQTPTRSHGVPLTRVSSSSVTRQATVNQGHSEGSSDHCRSIPEDRILISIDARATSHMTLSRMRRIYTRFDCRQISRVLGLALHENSTSILLLHNTGVHLNGSGRGMGAITIGYNLVRCFVPSPTEYTLVSVGGCHLLLGFIAQSHNQRAFLVSLKCLVSALRNNPKLQSQIEVMNGYQILTMLFWKKKQFLSKETLDLIIKLITECRRSYSGKKPKGDVRVIQQTTAVRDLICECFDLWLQVNMIDSVLEFIYDLIRSPEPEQQINESASNPKRIRNLRCLRDMDLLPRILRLIPINNDSITSSCNQLEEQSMLFEANQKMLTSDAKVIFLIKQIVFELLNRTPRQSDILYFGQFLASLLPSDETERPEQVLKLRNILLRSLLQMLTRNRQMEINYTMQGEFVRILGFDWFMLFICGPHFDTETTTLGFLNLMIVLSNSELYNIFKCKSRPNGGWLKEPTFPTIDGKFNIQMLGINVGVFFGLSGKRKTIRQDVLDAHNFYLLSSCLTNISTMPRIYLMIFQTMMGRLRSIDTQAMEIIGAFDKLTLDSLCDCLIGETHQKRRQTLSSIQFQCLELVICIVYMIREITLDTSGSTANCQDFPTDVIRFFMYLYNNNREFQVFCRSNDELIDALCETLILPEQDSLELSYESRSITPDRPMTQHPSSKEILELSRLIILDKMTDMTESATESDRLQAFERFLDSLSVCKAAQGELVDMLLRQSLLLIDSTARHNSISTISSSESMLQFQLLLTNSIAIADTVTDKIWSEELFQGNLGQVTKVLDHILCLSEQIFKFNELLPKHSPPHAFIMQRVLNRIILFALSRPMQHMSDKLQMLTLLRKIHENKTIIILNHMHCQHSAEFFVCLTYCLIRIIEENTTGTSEPKWTSRSIATDQPTSLIERQYGHPHNQQSTEAIMESPNSSGLILASQARKVWDAVYQSKKNILAEAFDVSMSLPAFTLDTSLDLMQLKNDIYESCERYWSNLIRSEMKQKKRLAPKTGEQPALGSSTSSAVNILSGRLTKVVNAASFVSRVVGATAGTMASNVNIVGEKLSQNRATRKDIVSRASVDSTGSVGSNTSGTSSIQQVSVGPTGAQIGAQQTDAFKSSSLRKSQIEKANQVHISIIQEYIQLQITQKDHKLAIHKYLCDEWLDIEYETLLRERAIFGPDWGSKLDRWRLDMIEGPKRMRKKLINNTKLFYENYSYNPEEHSPVNKSARHRPPVSLDSQTYYYRTLNVQYSLLDVDNRSNASGDRLLPEPTPGLSLQEITEQQPDKNQEHATRTSRPTLSGESNQEDNDVRSETPIINIERPSSSNKDLQSSLESLSLTPTKVRPPISPASSPKPASDYDPDEGDSTSFVDFSPEIEAETTRDSENMDSLSVLRLLEKNERISHMFRCSRVQGLDTYEGLLLFGREHFYLIDGFTLLKTREIKDIDSLPPDAHDPIIPNSTPNITARSKKTCAKFAFESVIEVHKRRYLLQPIALEVFSSDGRNTLIVFPRNIRNKVYTRLMTVATQMTNNATESLAGQKSHVSVESSSGLLSNLIGETSVTQRWVRGELSNFQYLMNLNTIAGRSYNDLMQYPIFPWILADYTSDQLDFTNPSTFRDLSRPIGAQTSERLEQFKRRYIEWDDTETPPYHYGTFYSSAMIVASYMVRMEPFTQHFLRLQGGHFDLADRMFHSINDSWQSASKHNMADIKELIPEFFYLPEFLVNSNRYDLGVKQNGMRLNDVILPPWAKGDAREFIRLHRCALESDYVSAHLHEWIDLIFGYKQQGQAAVDAINVFHHLFYEGNVDIYNTDIDPIKKNAVIGFINNFGQVPRQLFKKPHPARKVSGSNYSTPQASLPLNPILPSLSSSSSNAQSNMRVLTHYPQMLLLNNANFKELRGPVGLIAQVDKSIVAVEQNKMLVPPEYCRYIAWGHADRSLRMGLYDSEKPIFVWEGNEYLMPSDVLCCTIPNSRTMVTAGTESFITVWKIEKMRSFSPVLNLYGHMEPVTCLASSQAYSFIVSGSRDRTAILWDLNKFTFVRQLGGGPPDKLVHHGPISAIAINDTTGDIATCASSWLYLWTINGDLLVQVDTFNISLAQSFLNANSSISSNLNQLHILSVCFSQYNEWDLDEVIVTGASDGSVAFWGMRYYQCPTTIAKTEATKANKTNSESESSIDGANLIDNNAAKEPKEETSVTGEPPIVNSQVAEEEETPMHRRSSSKTTTTTEPIAIVNSGSSAGPRRRTDTMNSEWVKLSTSSASQSTTDTVPISRATPTSLNDTCLDIINAGESFTNDNLSFLHESNQTQQPTCSTPLASSPQIPESPLRSRVVGSLSKSNCDRDAPNVDEISLAPGDTKSPAADNIDGQSMSKANLLLTPNDPTVLKFSKSDTSLVDSFVILGDSNVSSSPTRASGSKSVTGSSSNERARPQSATSTSSEQHPSHPVRTRRRLANHRCNAPGACNSISCGGRFDNPGRYSAKLQPNHCWKRELYLRAVLPRRSSKNMPPAVTSLAISKDHKTLFVGDVTGRISTWCISN